MAYKRRLKFDKRLRFKKKMDIMYLLVFVLLLSIGTGYAYIRSNLNINGTANVTAANWDVHFENLQVTTGSVTATTPADITDDTTVEFAATLEEPNDFYEFTVDVTNDGTMDAMIDSFSISPTLTTAQAKYLEYTVSYSDGTPLANKQELKANTTETLKVRFSYIENNDKTNYPTEDQNFTIDFSMDYVQADGSEIEVDHSRTVYTVSTEFIYINQAIPNGIMQYDTAEEAMLEVSIPIYLKHKVQDDIVTESYVEFVVTPEMESTHTEMTAGTYVLRGTGATYNSSTSSYNDDSLYYAANKATLLSAFGSANCTDASSFFSCGVSDLYAQVYARGFVTAFDSNWNCDVYDDGYSRCFDS